jgi:hypothetical protein
LKMLPLHGFVAKTPPTVVTGAVGAPDTDDH